ncbi:hypothetical protein CDAR_419801 [Caerostris darwini]|uniref:Uncharacterized protein n=1 Tax=Caerostris darwini TaxID=1538125 RepID=A0AAV4MRI1_9ARAC|nr:hypothetical protein CDAR_419801 [Caerostris darwini]
MVATCDVGSLLYVLPMLLGRTYDMQHDTIGIDIFQQKDIDEAVKNPIVNPVVNSNYMTIEQTDEKRDFLGISGELGLKIAAGLVDIKGAGQYLRDTSNLENSVEILIKLTFTTLNMDLSPDAKPMTYWELLDPKSVGTHVVTSLSYGGEVYASVNFVAHKAEDFESIKGQILGSISKSGAFNAEAQGALEKLAQNISSKAKMEINYYATVPLDGVPTTIEGLVKLVQNFKDLVGKVNNGIGVALCAGLTPLEQYNDQFKFLKNQLLINALEQFSYYFDNLREAKALLITFISGLPNTVSKDYLNKIIDFSGRLTKTINVFYDVIGNLDLEKGSEQLSPAENAFDSNSAISGDKRYTKEIKKIMDEFTEKDDPYQPRGVYVHWGKSTCGNKASNPLFTGYATSFTDEGIGAGTKYLCLPETPNVNVDSDTTGLNMRTSKLGGVRYRNMSMFSGSGKNIEDKVAPCTVCETPLRPSVKMFAGVGVCPGDWVEEYTGYIVGNLNGKLRAEFACVDFNPDTYNITTKAARDPYIMPSMMGSSQEFSAGSSLPCVVCSK